jgi:hypothetical protein
MTIDTPANPPVSRGRARPPHDVAEVRQFVRRHRRLEDVDLEPGVRGLGLVAQHARQGLDDALLEAGSRMCGDDGLALLGSSRSKCRPGMSYSTPQVISRTSGRL